MLNSFSTYGDRNCWTLLTGGGLFAREQIELKRTCESALPCCFPDSEWSEEPYEPVKADWVLTEFPLGPFATEGI